MRRHYGLAQELALAGALIIGAAACAGDTTQVVSSGGGDEVPVDPDDEPPVIEHDAITDSQLYGEPISILAMVTDEGGGDVVVVEVYYKTETSTTWKSSAMVLGPSGFYEGKIEGDEVTGGGMNYFIYAVDTSGNEAWYPEDGEDDPFHFRVTG